jgi:uncharacterized protein YfcZ (UPF0381/DUF406 family)
VSAVGMRISQMYLLIIKLFSRNKQVYLPNIADSEVLNEVSQFVLKIDFVFVIQNQSQIFRLLMPVNPVFKVGDCHQALLLCQCWPTKIRN